MERDDPDALAGGLYALSSNPALRAILAERAHEGARAHYTVAQSAARLLDVYSAVSDQRPAGQSVA